MKALVKYFGMVVLFLVGGMGLRSLLLGYYELSILVLSFIGVWLLSKWDIRSATELREVEKKREEEEYWEGRRQVDEALKRIRETK